MGPIKTLNDIVAELVVLDEQATIFAAQPWTSESRAIVTCEPPVGGVPQEAKASGLDYFIEVSIAREFLEGWASTLDHAPSAQESCDRLIRYAVTDV